MLQVVINDDNIAHGHDNAETEEELAGVKKFIDALLEYNPEFKGPKTAPVVAEQILSLLHDSTVENQGGKFISHNRTDKWV